MKRSVIIAIVLAVALFAMSRSQEVVITGFPLGIGSDVDPGFFESYYPQLQSLADTLQKYPLSLAIVTGGVDGIRFDRNHDAQNPGLAVGRAQALRNLLVSEFDIDPGRILIQSSYSVDKGGPYRYAAVRVAREISNFEARIDSLEKRPPVEIPVTEVKEIYQSVTESMGLQLGAGVSSSPFGGTPIVSGAITWKRFVFIEGIFGHTFWDGSYSFENADLATRRRIAGGLATVYPLSKIPVGITGGWIRVEEISQRYNEYVRMSEGPVIGLRVTPVDYLSVTAIQNTAKHNVIGDIKSRLKNGQFLIFATIHVTFGGGR
ncbi:MAG: hypothetical protein JSW64_15780 [Candidatus Zixiibacteriota bacterium]|nr:MAG: hypothetical protein JSW64_15780 [candidate division Zixibacteria bacterium]